MGIRYDFDPYMGAPPLTSPSEILINSGIPSSYYHQLAGTNDIAARLYSSCGRTSSITRTSDN